MVGSATIGPSELLNVELPVTRPRPVSGELLERHVRPSSVDFFTWMSALLPASWYATQTVLPYDVIQGRSAPAWSSIDVRAAGGTGRPDRASGDGDTKLGELVPRTVDDVEIGQQRGASGGDLEVRISIANVHATLTVNRQARVHRTEVAGGRSERPLPEVDLVGKPREAVDGHRAV